MSDYDRWAENSGGSMDSIKAHEDLPVLVAVLIARANQRTLRAGNSNNRIMVDLDLLRRIEETVEAAQPGLMNTVRTRARSL